MRTHLRNATPESVTDGIVEGVLAADELAHARDDLLRILETTPTGRNNFGGFSTRRVYAPFKKTRAFDAAAMHPLALGVLDRLLGHYQFSAPVGIQIGPGEAAQALHRDEAIYPLPRPHPPVVLNTMWPLDDFTETNGATRLVACSHMWEPSRSPSRSTASVPRAFTSSTSRRPRYRRCGR